MARISLTMTPSARIRVSAVGSESKSAIDGSPPASVQGRCASTEVARARVSPTHRTISVSQFPDPAPFAAAKDFRGRISLRLFGGGVGSTGSVDMASLPQRNQRACSPGTMFEPGTNPPASVDCAYPAVSYRWCWPLVQSNPASARNPPLWRRSSAQRLVRQPHFCDGAAARRRVTAPSTARPQVRRANHIARRSAVSDSESTYIVRLGRPVAARRIG
jgi:hypothetical protein